MSKRIRKCSIDGCDSRVLARGLCSLHYTRLRKHGDPLGGNRRFLNSEESFAARTKCRGGCLLWTGSKYKDGYGQITVNGKQMRSHRYAWERVNGKVPPEMKVDHKFHCDPACCNVDHLRLATNAQNTANRSGPTAESTSGFRNVSWSKKKRKWQVQVVKDRKTYWFGYYEDVEEAASVAKQARFDLFGEFAGKG